MYGSCDSVAVVDLNGRILSRAQLPVTSDPEKTIAAIIKIMLRMKENHAQRSFEGVGLSLPGRVDVTSKRLQFAPNLGWPEFDIKGMVEKGTGLPVSWIMQRTHACWRRPGLGAYRRTRPRWRGCVERLSWCCSEDRSIGRSIRLLSNACSTGCELRVIQVQPVQVSYADPWLHQRRIVRVRPPKK